MPARVIRIILIFALIEVGIVGFGGRWASERWAFEYTTLLPVAYLVYALSGYFAARSSSMWYGALAGAAVAAIDAFVWAVLGTPGLDPQTKAQAPPGTFGVMVVVTGLIVALTGAVSGLLGGFAARWRRHPSAMSL